MYHGSKFLSVSFNQKYIPFHSTLSLSLSLSHTHTHTHSPLLSFSPYFSIKANASLSFFFFLFKNSILHNLSYWFVHDVGFVSFTGCTTLTMTESKGLWQARAAAADERTSRDSRAFSLGYHPVQAPRSARPWKAGGRAAGNRGRRYIRSSTGGKGKQVGVDTVLAGVQLLRGDRGPGKREKERERW